MKAFYWRFTSTVCVGLLVCITTSQPANGTGALEGLDDKTRSDDLLWFGNSDFWSPSPEPQSHELQIPRPLPISPPRIEVAKEGSFLRENSSHGKTKRHKRPKGGLERVFKTLKDFSDWREANFPDATEVLVSEGRKKIFILNYGVIGFDSFVDERPTASCKDFPLTPEQKAIGYVVPHGLEVLLYDHANAWRGTIEHVDGAPNYYFSFYEKFDDEIRLATWRTPPSEAKKPSSAFSAAMKARFGSNYSPLGRPNGKLYIGVAYTNMQKVLRDHFSEQYLSSGFPDFKYEGCQDDMEKNLDKWFAAYEGKS